LDFLEIITRKISLLSSLQGGKEAPISSKGIIPNVQMWAWKNYFGAKNRGSISETKQDKVN